MKTTTRLFFAILAFTGIVAKAWSQDIRYTSESAYKTSAGIRIGSENGFTFKHFYQPTWAFEATLTTGYRALVATALVEKHISLNVEGLNAFVGGGAHAGHFSRVAAYHRSGENGYEYKSYEVNPTAGVDGILGAEYKIEDIPFTVGVDIKPFFDFFTPNDSWVEGAFSLRYVFK